MSEKQLPENLKKYFLFKANQYFRITGLNETITEEEAKNFIKEQLEQKTPLVKGWILEAMAAGAV